ncbi:unnamed protein product [Cuscuta epithymum]|uniref:Uncharacterized protein n=1 Tax=Cuscuta epithymum TaxID=186058 RepID=A0AAV0DTF7_9ASTE|nr:unnamed protein product [Cuscuta epithymum]CAH9129707.1 unnamed protein product [Cuscuta epithymum]
MMWFMKIDALRALLEDF